MFDKFAKKLLMETDFTLEDLMGEHELSGVDVEDECVIFVLDEIPFIAVEDPGDGYRSHMEELKVYTGDIKNTFPPVRVVGSMRDEVLILTDISNGKVVFEVGTDNTDSYYPFFVSQWTPENLSIN